MKIVKESIINELNVPGKAKEKMFHIKGEFDDFENKHKSDNIKNSNGEVIYKGEPFDKDSNNIIIPTIIIKNPKNLENIQNYSRGIVTKDGDFYICNSDCLLHNNILDILYRLKEVKNEGIWWHGWPEGFLTVVRRSSNKFDIGESNEKYNDIFKEIRNWTYDNGWPDSDEKIKKFQKVYDEYVDVCNVYNDYLEPVKRKLPQFEFGVDIMPIEKFKKE